VSAPLANTNALRHGSRSERRVRPVAAQHRRLLLRRLNLKARELDALGRAYVYLLARLYAKITLADDYIEAHGLIARTITAAGAGRVHQLGELGAADAQPAGGALAPDEPGPGRAGRLSRGELRDRR
jgi:hypothetical protein